MNITTFVALSLLSLSCFAGEPLFSIQAIESEWNHIYYKIPKDKQAEAYTLLLKKTEELPEVASIKPEQLYWEALIIATKADFQEGFTALRSAHRSKDLLLEALKLNPKTANGSAFVLLGTLYYMVPQWPIGFGDNEKAEQMFKAALKINPNAIDANYFYGDYLLTNNKTKEAKKYFEKALSIPSRKEQLFADENLKSEAKLALTNARDRKLGGVKSAFLSLFTSASLE